MNEQDLHTHALSMARDHARYAAKFAVKAIEYRRKVTEYSAAYRHGVVSRTELDTMCVRLADAERGARVSGSCALTLIS